MTFTKILILIFALAISVYSLLTEYFSYNGIPSLLFGILIGILAIEEFKNKGRNSWGIFYMLVSLIIIVGTLFTF